jgi:GntR family transcriptional repressor for pyruvate dehydrogenase complex
MARLTTADLTTPVAPSAKEGQSPTPSFRPARPRRAFEEIIHQIKALIEAGALKPGDKLPSERALAAEFQVSRNTLREALRTLELGGQITLRRGASGGAFVADPAPPGNNDHVIPSLRVTDFSVADLTEAMRLVTGMLLQACAPIVTDEDLAALEAYVDEAEKARSDPKQRSELLIQFYLLLAEASGNKILVVIANLYVEMLRGWVGKLGSLSGDRVIRSRRSLISRLRERDLPGALADYEIYLKELHDLWLRG